MDKNAQQQAACAAAFFRSQSGFSRLFALFSRKYRSLGRMSGSVKLPKLTAAERQALSSFFRMNLEGQEALTLSFAQFIAALQATRFGDVEILELLQAYNDGNLQTNRQRQAAAAVARQQFFSELRASVQEPRGLLWLSQVKTKAPGTRRAQAVYEQGRPDNLNAFQIVLAALGNLPTEYLRLPLFAQQIAGQPHALDSSTGAGRLFLEALQVIEQASGLGLREENQTGLTAVEREAELLYRFNLLRDDLLNFVTCAGLAALKSKNGRQQPVAYWQQAWEDGAVLNVPLREVVKYTAFVPAAKRADGQPEKKVFIVENSGVFSAIADKVTAQGNRLPPLVCLQGQFKLASWTVLDRLVSGGCTLYYSGDFDPEGLWMAERLVKRYPAAARLWHYRTEDYQATLESNDSGYLPDTISDSRLKQLDGLSLPELLAVAECLQKTGQAGYQEALVEQLTNDCLEYVQS